MLNHERGELIGDCGPDYVVVPVYKWSDTAFYDQAVAAAKRAFEEAGALLPIHIDGRSILVQEYHSANRLVFLFHRKIAGEDYYHPHVFDLSPGVVKELTDAGRWHRPTRH